MPKLAQYLELERCPHCAIHKPNLKAIIQPLFTSSHDGESKKYWCLYYCSNCGEGIIASAYESNGPIISIYPAPAQLDDTIPIKVKKYLQQAMDSIHAPAGSVMLSASAVDAMLKEKGYNTGSLFSRIALAANENLITKEMATWAHQVRLDANDQRHADVEVDLPNEVDAKRSISFAKALAEFLFVLPAKIQKGLQDSTE